MIPVAGIKEELLVEAHGTFSTASCISCKVKHDPEKVRKDVFNDTVTRCTHCRVNILMIYVIFMLIGIVLLRVIVNYLNT